MLTTQVASAKEIFIKGDLTLRILFLCLVIICSVASTQAQTNTSAYTDLDRKFCRTLLLRDAELIEYEGRCSGLGGYKLLVTQEDTSHDLSVVTPKGEKNSLNLWNPASQASSSLGPKAEWRLKTEAGKSTPVALIVRYNFAETNSPNKKASFLVVVKITPKEICVTDKINSGSNANEEARRSADMSATQPCFKAY
jgi:hypothetical protein